MTATYTLDQAAALSQVLYDEVYTYTYGLERISQQNAAGTDYFIPDGALGAPEGVLGSARQLANGSGKVILSQSFDPFGNSLARKGFASSSYGYTGEWTDGSGLQYLRARYYSPTLGRFLTSDPYWGVQGQPSTLTTYVYAGNNLAMHTDPSGKILPFLTTALVASVIGGGLDLVSQFLPIQPSSLSQAWRCIHWIEVGIAAGAGAIAGLA